MNLPLAISAQLHKMLSERTMYSDEILNKYFLKMKQLSMNGYIEDVMLISSIIKDIKDYIMEKYICCMIALLWMNFTQN